MPKKCIQWLIDHNFKFLVYFAWIIALPIFLFAYLGQAMQDALYELNEIKEIKKEKY